MPGKYLTVKAAAKIFANQQVMSKVKVFLQDSKKKKKYQSEIILRTTKQNMNYSNKEFEKIQMIPKSS